MRRGDERLGLARARRAARRGRAALAAAAKRAARSSAALVFAIGAIAARPERARPFRRRSRSARHRRRPARCRSSGRSPQHRHAPALSLNSPHGPVTPPARRPRAADRVDIRAAQHERLQIRFPARPAERGYIHQISDPAGLDSAARDGASSPMSATTARRPRCMSGTCSRS